LPNAGRRRLRRTLAPAVVLAQAVDASIRVRQRVEPGFGDLRVAELAAAVNAFNDPLQGMLDLAEFAAFNLDQLRANLIVGGINRGVDVITNNIESGKLTETLQVTVQSFPQGISRATNRE